MKNTLKSFTKIINHQTALVTGASIGATYLCHKYNFQADFPLTLIGIAVVFPLVFSINSAYKRRETALNHYGNIKGLSRAIYFASQDWLEKPDSTQTKNIKSAIEKLFQSINKYLHAEDKDLLTVEKQILNNFRNLSKTIKGFRPLGMSGSEVSRTNQYLSKLLISFEQLKHIQQYRTPLTLRAYSRVFISILPIIYGPYFVEVAKEANPILMYTLPTLFSVILVSLDNIQEHLENPFDRIGEDDIYINTEKFIDNLK